MHAVPHPDPSTAPGSASERTRVFFWSRDSWACGWYRCYIPGVALKKLGYTVVMDEEMQDGDIDTNDVIVVQAPSDPEHLRAIRMANEAGKLTVVEMDDDLWNLSPTNPGYAHWNNPEVKAIVRASVAEAGLCTTPTHMLAERLRTMNPNVKVLPNMLPSEGWDYPDPQLKEDGPVVLGWAGSTSHGGDLIMIDNVIGQLLDRYPNVEFAVAGGPPAREISVRQRIRFLDPTNIQGYPAMLENFDIGLIPLADTAFNRAKSDLKFVEYSMLGIPSVLTKLDPYLRSVKHGENGFFASSPKDWLKHLSRLIEDPKLRLDIGARAQEFARSRRIDNAIDRWVKAYGLSPVHEE